MHQKKTNIFITLGKAFLSMIWKSIREKIDISNYVILEIVGTAKKKQQIKTKVNKPVEKYWQHTIER